jgi:hypothetical protein
MIDDEAALVADIRFALRGLDPWPPKDRVVPSEDCDHSGRLPRLTLLGLLRGALRRSSSARRRRSASASALASARSASALAAPAKARI